MLPTDEMMPVSGVYRHTLDSKNRVFIPAKHREAIGTPMMLLPSIRDRSIKIYSIAEWRELMAKIALMPMKDRERVNRFYNGSGDTVTPDSQGRITLNADLVKHAGLSDSVVIVGCGTSAEIWAADEYDRLQSETDIDEIRAALEAYGL